MICFGFSQFLCHQSNTCHTKIKNKTVSTTPMSSEWHIFTFILYLGIVKNTGFLETEVCLGYFPMFGYRSLRLCFFRGRAVRIKIGIDQHMSSCDYKGDSLVIKEKTVQTLENEVNTPNKPTLAQESQCPGKSVFFSPCVLLCSGRSLTELF